MVLPKLTLLVLTHNNKILLGLKKRGFGKGNYNGYGGKLDPGETLLDCVCRETYEEAGIVLDKKNVVRVAIHDFIFPHKPEWNQQVHVFRATSFTGTPVETEEMKPLSFPMDALPLDHMWDDDKYWLQQVLDGKKLRTTFSFDELGKVKEHEIVEVDEFSDE